MGVLKAKVGGAWVPILQGQAYASGSYVGSVSLSAGQTGFGTTAADITGLSVSFTADPSHTYKTTLIAHCQQITSGGYASLVLANAAGTQLDGHSMSGLANDISTLTVVYVETGVSGAQVRKGRMLTSAGTVNLFAGPDYHAVILVEDITPIGGVVLLETQTFTPTWSGWTIGSGGGDYCRYTFIGTPGVGGIGMLTMDVVSQLGTSGYSVAGNPTINLPTGFNIYPGPAGVNREPVGRVIFRDADLSKHLFGAAECSTANTIRLYAEDVSGTYMTEATITATVPFTWANGDMIRAMIGPFPAIRV